MSSGGRFPGLLPRRWWAWRLVPVVRLANSHCECPARRAYCRTLRCDQSDLEMTSLRRGDGQFLRLGILRLVRVLGADVQLQLRKHGHAELVLREHAADGLAEDQLGALLEAVARLDRPLPRVAGVPGVGL